MSALEAIRADIADLRDALAGINARREQIDPEIAEYRGAIEALEDERRRCYVDSEQAAIAIRRLERAEALLSEQEETEPVPEPQEPPVAAPEPVRHVTVRGSRPAAPERPVAAPPEGHTRRAVHQPLQVATRNAPMGRSRPKPNGVTGITDGGYSDVDINALSSTEQARVALVAAWLEGGPMSQIELRDALAEELGCIPGTSQSIAGRSLAILYKQGRVEDTGERGEDARGRKTSIVWKLVR